MPRQPDPSRNSRARRRRGFTLFELLVVMALLGVAVLLAARSAEPMVRAAREHRWIDRLQAELIRARSRARISGRISVVRFVPARQEIRFETDTPTRTLALPKGFRFERAADNGSATDAGTRTLLFFPDGTASGLELVLAVGARTTVIRVFGVSGKIKILTSRTGTAPAA